MEISVGGRAAFYNYQNEISRSDLEKAELITFPVTLVVLLLVFGSVRRRRPARPAGAWSAWA